MRAISDHRSAQRNPLRNHRLQRSQRLTAAIELMDAKVTEVLDVRPQLLL
jgi:hypothetical protein